MPDRHAHENTLIVSEYANPGDGDLPLTINNKDTGAPVLLERVHWEVRNDLAGNAVSCTDYQWNDNRGEYFFEFSSSTDHYYYPNYVCLCESQTAGTNITVQMK